jgi:hypothetical protein
MTRLAVDPGVLAPPARLNHVVVALFARLMAGVSDGEGCNVVESAGPEMPVVAEPTRDGQGAHEKENEDTGREETRHPD